MENDIYDPLWPIPNASYDIQVRECAILFPVIHG
jgi:hypothetical protein